MNIGNLIFAKEKAMVTDFLDETMGLRAQSDIQVIQDYPFGWHANVAADNRAMFIGYNKGFMCLIDVGLCRGFHPNGTMRIVGVDDDANFRKLEDFYASELYREDFYRSPLNCMGSACNSASANCVMCNNH